MFPEMQALLGTAWAYWLSFGVLLIWWGAYKWLKK